MRGGPHISVSKHHSWIFAKNHGRASSSNPKWPSFHMTKDTQKALAIIIAALGVLAGLLVWANHLRPHP
jgi:hypothetical protein